MKEGGARRSRRDGEIPGRGERVDPRVRRRVEEATGEDVDHVRVHRSPAARQFVDGLGARGASVGRDVALGSEVASGSDPVSALTRDVVLTHEIAHALQQRDARPGSVTEQRSAGHEAEADMVAAAAFAGGRRSVRAGGSGLALQRCDGDAPPKVKEAAKKTDPAKLSGFEKMVGGGVPAADAADKMQLPKELTDAMDEAWKNSFPGGKSKEQGGLLVKKSDGSLDFVKATKSTSGSTTLPWGDVPKGATPIADAHTHPYDKGEGGHQGVAFSAADLSTMVTDKTGVQVVHAGSKYWAISKTAEFEKTVAGKNAADKAKLKAEIDAEWKKAFDAEGGDLAAKASAGTKAVAKKYNLIVYEGNLKGEMEKVDVTK